jgi:hypothetical protein
MEWTHRLGRRQPAGRARCATVRTHPPCCSCCCSPRQPAPPQHIPSPTRAPAATPPGQSRAQLVACVVGRVGSGSGCGAVDALRDSCRAAASTSKERCPRLSNESPHTRARAGPERGRAGDGPGSIDRVLIQTIQGGACDALGDGAGIGVRIIAPSVLDKSLGAGGGAVMVMGASASASAIGVRVRESDDERRARAAGFLADLMPPAQANRSTS